MAFISLPRFSQVRSGIRQVDAMMRLPQERGREDFVPLAPQVAGHIQYSHVTFRYTLDSDPVLWNIDFVVNPGEVVALVGSNGCGKSTIVKLLLALYRPQSGTILIDGHEADSTGRRNTFSLTGLQALVQSFGGSSPSEGLAGPCIERVSNNCEYVRTVYAQIGSFREVLSKQSIWCSRSFRVAKGCAVRRSRREGRLRSEDPHAWPSLLPGPRAASGEAALATPCRVRSTWRMQLAPSRPIRPPSAYRHSNLLCQSVATTD